MTKARERRKSKAPETKVNAVPDFTTNNDPFIHHRKKLENGEDILLKDYLRRSSALLVGNERAREDM